MLYSDVFIANNFSKFLEGRTAYTEFFWGGFMCHVPHFPWATPSMSHITEFYL
jgi:hypothetical protein